MKMTVIPVKVAKRKQKRDIDNSVRKDILSYLAELITNSDDSYTRLEQNGQSTGGKIFITLNKKGKKDFEISVIDFAEGMSRDMLEKKFSVYGNDNAGGVEKHVRGIFGQGLSDILRNASSEGRTAMVESICDGMYTKMNYVYDETETEVNLAIDVSDSIRANDLLRNKLGIYKNGTKVTFGIPSTVEFGPKIQKTLPELIEKCSTFRYLLDEDYSSRKVYYGQNIISAESTKPLSSYKFRMCGDCLYDDDISFLYGANVVRGHLRVFKKVNQEDDAKIIVRDENYAVFDDTSFSVRYMQDIVGELEIVGLYKICYDALNREKNPEALLSDNRTGFDTKKMFYKNMEDCIYKILSKILDSGSNSVVSIDNKEVKQGLSEINKYINNILKEENIGGNVAGNQPPESGIKFVRGDATITKGKKYGLRLLINSNQIRTDNTIEISVENNSGNIEVSPLSISYDRTDVSETGLVVKNITIEANDETENPVTITATCLNYITTTYIGVVKESVHIPECGLEFYPNELDLVIDKPHKLELYFDSKIVQLGETIQIDCGGLIGITSYQLTEENIIGDTEIGKIDVILEGGEIGKKYTVHASYGEIITEASVTIIASKDQKSSNGALSINGIRLDDKFDSWVQVFFDPRDGIVYVNKSTNQVNKKFFGDSKSLTNDVNNRAPEQRRYVCELVTNCISSELVKKKGGFKKRDINTGGLLEDIVAEIQDAQQKYKNEIFDIFYRFLFKGPNSR